MKSSLTHLFVCSLAILLANSALADGLSGTIPASGALVATPATGNQLQLAKTRSKTVVVHTQKRSKKNTSASDSAYQNALAAIRQGRISEAQNFLQNQLRQTPGNLSARKLLAMLLIDAADQPAAIQVLSEGQRISPSSTDIAMTLARLQADQNDLEAARKTLARSASYAQKQGDYLAFQAALEQKTGHHDQACQLLEQALLARPGNGKWLLALGISQEILEDHGNAQSHLEAALQTGQLDDEQQKLARATLIRIKNLSN